MLQKFLIAKSDVMMRAQKSLTFIEYIFGKKCAQSYCRAMKQCSMLLQGNEAVLICESLVEKLDQTPSKYAAVSNRIVVNAGSTCISIAGSTYK